MSKGGRYARKKEKKPLTGKKIALIVVCVILVVVLAVVIAGVSYYQSMLKRIKYVEVPKIEYTKATTEATEETQATAETMMETTVETTAPHVASSADYLNFLVVGQAGREGEAERFADTMILVTVNTYEKTLTMTSMLRDTLVKMADYKGHYGGNIKLTTVYHLGSVYGEGIPGSMELIDLTLFNNFGIEVDYNFEVDFDIFVKIVDLVGGVDIDLTQAEADYLNKDDLWVYYDVEPGLQMLDGMTALSYARMRKAEGDADSDITRTSRQRKLVEAILTKLKSKSLSELQSIANEILSLVTTSMTSQEITECLLTLLPMLPELTIQTGGTCPANYWGDMVDIYSDGFQHSVLRFDVKETTKYMRAITEGETAE